VSAVASGPARARLVGGEVEVAAEGEVVQVREVRLERDAGGR